MPIRKLNWDQDTEQGLDLRGWTLLDENGAELGRIDDLLVDSAAGKIRYAVASVPRRVLLPVGQLDLDERHKAIKARGFTRDLLVTLSEYEEGELSAVQERRHFRETLGHERELPVDYEHERFQSRNQRMQELEERFRAVEARRAARQTDRELTFSGTEPTQADLQERRRLEGIRTTEDATFKPKTKIDIVPIDDRQP